MGLLIDDPAKMPAVRRNRSDLFYEHLTQSGGLTELVRRLLPVRRPEKSFDTVQNHDERAAIVCALTALCVAAGDYTAVGDQDGWIVLPPQSLIQPWAWTLLVENAVHGGLEWRCWRS
jgi:hypothetical protein